MLGALLTELLSTALVSATSKSQSYYKNHLRKKEFSEAVGDLATEFNRALRDAIEDAARDENQELAAIALSWDATGIAKEFDAVEAFTENERDAIDRVATAIQSATDTNLDETAEAELYAIISDAYADAIEDFKQRVINEDLAEQLQLEQLDKIVERLRSLEPRPRYDLFSADEERHAAVRDLVGVDRVEFVDRPEINDVSLGWTLVIGPAGSGKTRVLGELVHRAESESLKHILIPGEELLVPEDVIRAFNEETFGGDVLLMWDDVHAVNPEQNNVVVRKVVKELQAILHEQGHELHILFAARSGNLNDLPGNVVPPSGLWTDFSVLSLTELTDDHLIQIADRLAEAYDVSMTDGVRHSLVARASGSKSAPKYIESAIQSADGGELTEADVDDLAETVEGIWLEQYNQLKNTDRKAWLVLISLKLLSDLNIPLGTALVQGLFEQALDAVDDARTFDDAVEALVQRQWIKVSVNQTDLNIGSEFRMHDTQIEAVDARVVEHEREMKRFSEFLRGISSTWAFSDVLTLLTVHSMFATNLPHEEPFLRLKQIHFEDAIRIGRDFIRGRMRYAMNLSRQEDSSIWDSGSESVRAQFNQIQRIRPPLAQTYVNFARFLGMKEEFEKAKNQLDEGMTYHPQNPVLHIEYANLHLLTGNPEAAKERVENALDLDEESVRANILYGHLLMLGDEFETAKDYFEKGLRLDAESVLVHAAYANFLKEKNDLEAAKEHVTKALQIDPDDRTANIVSVDILEEEGEMDAARDQLKNIGPPDNIPGDPSNVYAERLYSLGEVQQAKDHLDEALCRDPDNIDARRSYAYILLGEGEFEAAKDHVGELIRLEPDSSIHHAIYAGLLQITGDTEKAREQVEKAKEHFEKAISLKPDSSIPHATYAYFLQRTGDTEKAKEQYEEALELDPDNSLTHANYATLLQEEREHEEAKYHYEEALRRDPDILFAHGKYGVLLLETGKIEKAKKHLEEVLRLDPESWVGHWQYGFTLLLSGEVEKAKEHFEKAISLKPDDGFVCAVYAVLLKEDQQFDEAKKHFEEALRLDPENPGIHIQYAYLLMDLGDVEAAKEHLKAGLRQNPDKPKAQAAYGLLLKHTEEYNKAKEHFETALRLAEDAAILHAHYGDVLRELDDIEQAENHFQEALRLDPDSVDAHTKYAILLFQQNCHATAKNHLEEALRIDPNSKRVAAYVYLLNEMGVTDVVEEFEKEVLEHEPKDN